MKDGTEPVGEYERAYSEAVKLVEWGGNHAVTARAIVYNISTTIDELIKRLSGEKSKRKTTEIRREILRLQDQYWGFCDGYRHKTGVDLDALDTSSNN